VFGTFGTFEAVLGLLLSGVVLLSSVIWIWTIVECAVTEHNDSEDKVAWLLLVLFTHVLGAALYCLIRRPKRLLEKGGRTKPGESLQEA
jgi:hypothetical protein